MDFMMQDIDTMPFRLLDKSWLGLQHVSTSMEFYTHALDVSRSWESLCLMNITYISPYTVWLSSSQPRNTFKMELATLFIIKMDLVEEIKCH